MDNQTRIIQLPFAGFYESEHSSMLDHVEEQEAEYFAETDREEQPKELQLTKSEFAEIFYQATSYKDAHLAVAKDYVESFANCIKREGIDLPLAYESMLSPREYNFTTDRVFAYVSLDKLAPLLESVDKTRLAAVIAARHTSYDGFISFYSADLEEWLEKPLADWDHNELETLLLSCLPEDWEDITFYALTEWIDYHEAFSSAVDWADFDIRVEDKRDEKRSELDPEYVIPAPRCKFTLDLFAPNDQK